MEIKAEIKSENQKEKIVYTLSGYQYEVRDFYYALSSAIKYYSQKNPLSPQIIITKYPDNNERAEKDTVSFMIPAEREFMYILERIGTQAILPQLTAHAFYLEYKTQKAILTKKQKEDNRQKTEMEQARKQEEAAELKKDLIVLFGDDE